MLPVKLRVTLLVRFTVELAGKNIALTPVPEIDGVTV